MLMGEVRAEQFMSVLAPEVRETLSSEQERAIRAAAESNTWNTHPVDLRLSLPTPFGRYYMALVAGPERRSAARRAMDRKRHALLKPGNMVLMAFVFLLVAWILLGA